MSATVLHLVPRHRETGLSFEERLASHMRLACTPEPFIDALRYGRDGELVRMGNLEIVVADHHGTDDYGIVAAWSAVCDLQGKVGRRMRLTGAAGDALLMFRTTLPTQLDALVWPDSLVIVCSPVTGRTALTTALRAAGYPPVHETHLRLVGPRRAA